MESYFIKLCLFNDHELSLCSYAWYYFNWLKHSIRRKLHGWTWKGYAHVKHEWNCNRNIYWHTFMHAMPVYRKDFKECPWPGGTSDRGMDRPAEITRSYTHYRPRACAPPHSVGLRHAARSINYFANNSRLFWITLKAKLLLRQSHVYKNATAFVTNFKLTWYEKWKTFSSQNMASVPTYVVWHESVLLRRVIIIHVSHSSRYQHSPFNNGCRRLWIILVSGSIN